MKWIYRLPGLIFVAVCGFIICSITSDIRASKSADIFEMIENGGATVSENTAGTILGVDSYMFLMMVGLFFAIVLAVLRKNVIGVNAGVAAAIALAFFFQAYFGAKVLYGIENVLNEKSLSAFTMDGQSLYGTIPVTLLFIWILSVLLKKNYGQLLDYVAPFWLTLLVFVRTGCFVTGCCGADACVLGGAELILPVQLFEVACDLILLQLIFNIEKKRNWTDGSKRMDGSNFFIMIGAYGIYRFALEFLRSTPVIFMGMTYGQIYSLICVVAAVIYLLAAKRKTTII